ncbi:barstar family protein [Rhodococcus sp. NPDC059968]|uniref:barstar family protein n=1 Tax=Rhodococcus sp. NPDC059968 TaxID=3347017 RepID=UPI00366D6A49
MAHRGVFDPTDRDVFNEQRQRFDWSLLQNGNVHRYDTAFQLDSACARLTDLGYLVHRIDAHPWTTVANMHTAFAKAMSFPAHYGRNLDAFNDVLSDVARFDYGSDPASSGTVLAIAGYDTLAGMDRRTAGIVLDIFAVQARVAALYAHPMLCLVESTVTDYPAVGGRPVYFGSVWDLGPDPPAPFHDGDLVENVLQIYADEATASKYVAALHPVLADTLAALGRWQILNPVLASERTAAFHAKHRPKPPPPGTRLWEIFIGLQGAGDHTILGDQLVHVLSDAGMHFDQLITRFYTAGTEERRQALSHYPDRRNPDDR